MAGGGGGQEGGRVGRVREQCGLVVVVSVEH